MRYPCEIKWAIQNSRIQPSTLRFSKKAKVNTLFLTEKMTIRLRSFFCLLFKKVCV